MKLFHVEEGTRMIIVENLEGLGRPSYKEHEARHDINFERHEMIADPIPIHQDRIDPCTPDQDHVLGGQWAAKGFYAFRREGHTCLVAGNKVDLWQ